MNDRAEPLEREGKDMGEEAREIAADVNEIVEETTDFVRQQALQRPYVTLASAFGVGYVLGGGVPTWALRALLAVGGKIALNTLINELGKTTIPTDADPSFHG